MLHYSFRHDLSSYIIHSLQVDNESAVVEGCVEELSTQNEPSCPRGYQFESDREDWTIVTEVTVLALTSDW